MIALPLEEGIRLLEKFFAREGHSLVPLSHTEDGEPLGKWMQAQRSSHRHGRMSSERAAALEAVPAWTWEAPPRAKRRASSNAVHGRLFADGVKALAQFAAREGHCRVPRHHQEGGINLGVWVDNRRSAYRNGILAAEQIAQLEAFPGWVWGPYDDRWIREYRLLLDYTAAHGNPRPPKGTIVDGVDLGHWADLQHREGRHGRLSAERRAQLETIPGWSWGVRTPRGADFRRWPRWISLLEAFLEREGHSVVPQHHLEDGASLGDWVFTRRREYRRGHLQPQGIAMLEAVPGWEWRCPGEDTEVGGVRAGRWQEGMRALRAFVAREGSAVVPVRHVEGGYRLGAWVAAQRRSYKQGTLARDRVTVLDGIFGWKWEETRGRGSAATAKAA